LLVEDSEADAKLVSRELSRIGQPVEFERVDDAEAMRDALLRGPIDAIASDWSMPRMTARAALALVQELRLDIPFIIVSGTIGEERAVDLLRAGARDVVLKDNLSRLNPAMLRELAEKRERDAKRDAEERARESDERYRVLFEGSPMPQWVYDSATLAILAANEAMVRTYGFSREELAAMTLLDIFPEEDVPALLDELPHEPYEQGRIWRHRTKDGTILTTEIYAHPIEFGGRDARLIVANDVTERRRLEEHLRQSQKMDSVGRLAGGVAHDFNNLLSVILSYCEMMLDGMPADTPMRDDLGEIHGAAKRAADLTSQLLRFSRQQVLKPQVVDINEELAAMDRRLRHWLGADIDLVTITTKPLGRVRVITGTIDQIIMNLSLNARDAMPTGGKLTLETSNVTIDEDYARQHLGVKPGHYVMLAVTDSGVGMDKATQARIFEPFFTTKALGKGTGLGLSTVFGVVKQSGGSLWLYSEVGKGTTFKVYLPRIDDDDIEPVEREVPLRSLRGDETILLVEDDDQVRTVARGILTRSGYTVVEARDAAEAIERSADLPDSFDLMLSDVVMPQMSGPELAKRLANEQPKMLVLCMSGYTDDSIVRHGVLDARMAYLQKPLTPVALTRKVREVLDAEKQRKE